MLTNSPGKPVFSESAAYYIRQTTRPLFALTVMIPLLLWYEIGTFAAGSAASRSGFEQLLFSGLGNVPALIGPLLCILLTLYWHRRSGDTWTLDTRHLPLLALESLVLGAMIFFAINAIRVGLSEGMTPQPSEPLTWIERLHVFSRICGTSVFEEVAFRMLLLAGCLAFLRRIQWGERLAIVTAVAFSSVLFSALHFSNWNPAGDPFHWLGFCCRGLVGAAFAIIFLYRGLAVSIVAHLAYNGLFLGSLP